MRSDLSSSITNAFAVSDGVRLQSKLHIYPTRRFISEAGGTAYASARAQSAGIPATPLPQDGFIGVYDEHFWSLIGGGTITIATGFAAEITPTAAGSALLCDTYGRPSWHDGGTAGYIWAYRSIGGTIWRTSFDPALISAGSAACTVVDATTGLVVTTEPSLHAFSVTDFAMLWVDEGGVRPSYVEYDAGVPAWVQNDAPGRFMHPTTVFTESSHASGLNYSAAVKDAGTIFIYYTMPDGDVRGIYYDTVSENWSDTFEAVPADLSEFKLTNGFIDQNGNINLAGQFQRVDPDDKFSSTYVLNMLLTSRDGINFSFDRTTAFAGSDTSGTASIAYRWFADTGGTISTDYGTDGDTGIVFQDAGRWAAFDTHWTVDSGADYTEVTDVIKVSGNYDTWDVTVANSDRSNDSSFAIGNLCEIHTGISNAAGSVEYFLLQRGIIRSINEAWRDGKRDMTLGVQAWSSARVDMMSYPFGFELKSKESVYDSLATFDNLFAASEDGFLVTPFMVDLWSESTVSPGNNTADGSTEYTTIDLLDIGLVNYPTIDELPITIEMYGWSRSGGASQKSGGGDTPSGGTAVPNDAVSCNLYVTHSDGTEGTIAVGTANAVGGTAWFPQTWYGTAAGTYPVALSAGTADGLIVDDKITKVGFVFENTRPSNEITTFYPERIEIPSVSMHLRVDDDDWGAVTEAAIPACNLEWIETTGSGATQIDGKIYEFESPASWGGIIYKLTGPYTAVTGDRVVVNATCTYTATTTSAKLMQPDAYLPKISGDTSGLTGIVTDDDVELIGTTITAGTDISSGGYFKLSVQAASTWLITQIGIKHLAGGTTVFWDVNGTCPEPGFPAKDGQDLNRFGIPVVYFASKPYWAFNFETSAEYKLTGDDAFGGVVGLGSDAQNYIGARANPGTVEIFKVRDGLHTTLASTANTWPDYYGWTLLRHQDGELSMRIRDDTDWGTALLSYSWTEADGQMAVDADILHVGIYGLKNVPWMRACSFDLLKGDKIGVLPGRSDLRDGEFSASGQIKIDGNVYAYTSYTVNQGGTVTVPIEGPFQGRNSAEYDGYQNDGQAYSGLASEFTRFEWIDNAANVDGLDGWYMATNEGFAWDIANTDYKPFITTNGVRVYLRNRNRLFSTEIEGDQIGTSVKVWLTDGFDGITLVSGDGEVIHDEGAIIALWNDSVVRVFTFYASSGDEDSTIADMIKRIVHLASGDVNFPADASTASLALTGTAATVATYE